MTCGVPPAALIAGPVDAIDVHGDVCNTGDCGGGALKGTGMDIGLVMYCNWCIGCEGIMYTYGMPDASWNTTDCMPGYAGTCGGMQNDVGVDDPNDVGDGNALSGVAGDVG